MESYLGIVFSVAALAGLVMLLGVVLLWRRQDRARGRRSPLFRHHLRSPGESLRARIEDVRWDFAMYLAVGMLPLPLAYGFFLSEWIRMGAPPRTVTVVLFALFAIGAIGWFGWKLWRILKTTRELSLALDAEIAVGQELIELMAHGYRVFHDFPVDERKFNIDHVLVGPGGVFAVETKGRAKQARRGEGTASWEVGYDGATLNFPGWKESAPLRQAEACADWLEKWLTSAVGDRVEVQPVLVLPGWYVKRTSGKGIPVLAVGQIKSFFSKAGRLLDEKTTQRVAHQLEQRCRDVEPTAYRPGERN